MRPFHGTHMSNLALDPSLGPSRATTLQRDRVVVSAARAVAQLVDDSESRLEAEHGVGHRPVSRHAAARPGRTLPILGDESGYILRQATSIGREEMEARTDGERKGAEQGKEKLAERLEG
jgi:hypothetical protein